jgi:hypothetical protein
MGRVGEAVQEADGDRLNPFALQKRDEGGDRALIEWEQDASAGIDALWDWQAEITGD